MADVLLSGNLGSISLASILQLADSDGLTGLVQAGGGELSLFDGMVVEASFHGLEGVDAIIECMVRSAGPFVLLDTPHAPATALMQTHSLIVESFRVVDDLHRFGPMVLPEGVTEALPSDGERSVVELVQAHGLHLCTVLPALASLQDAGGLRPLRSTGPVELEDLQIQGEATASSVAPAPAAPPAPRIDPTLGFDDLLFEARRLARQRRFDEAIEAMNAAMALQPDSRIAHQNLKRIQALQSQA